MKKVYLILVIATIVVNANAQWFLGGNIGLHVSSIADTRESAKLTPSQSSIGFSIAPKFGYYFNEKLAIGLDLAVGPTFAKKTEIFDHVPWLGTYKETSIHWRFSPFIRYSVFNYKKFSLILEGSIGAGATHGSREIIQTPEFILPLKEKYSIISVGIFNVVPALSYKLTDHLQLEAQLNFLNLGYNIDIYGFDGNGSGVTALKHDFNIGINSKSVFVVSQLTVGAIYKF
jgi:hypothetical protein